MAEWATLKAGHSLRQERNFFSNALVPLILGAILARGSVLGVHPFGVAFGAALILRGRKGFQLGLLGVVAGELSLRDPVAALQVLLILGALTVVFPKIRENKREGFYLAALTALAAALVAAVALSFSDPDPLALLAVGLYSVLSGGIAVVFWFALTHQEAVWRGEFKGEQGVAWLLILIGALSGLNGLQIAEFNFPVVVLSFFILFVAERYGAGTAAGVGAVLGFLPSLSLDGQNFINAGMYGLTGFLTGAFRRFGKLGLGAAFLAVTLMFSYFMHQEELYSQLVSSALGLVLFLVWPSAGVKPDFLKEKPIPEVEATVSKVKALAEIMDQIALSYQAAEVETTDGRPEIPELMNVLVERVCHSCPTINVCWEREFYKTYRYLFDLFEQVERRRSLKAADLPVELRRHCGRTKEMLLGVQFIIEKEQNHEAWRKRLALNQEALSKQFKNVSQVIGQFAKELHVRHNWEDDKSSGLARRRRNFLDVGVASFSKMGNGISGDNYASLAHAPTSHSFILCDGMGVGEGAAKISATALTHLEQLLSTGFEPEGAIQALNSILVLRSPEESFVTVDMAVLDLESDVVKLIKAGASPSYLKQKEKLEVLSSSGLPVGILNQIELQVLEVEMGVGDVLVMVTDGIDDALKDGTEWLEYFLEELPVKDSQELANEIAQEARRLSNEQMYDDGVVLVIKKDFWDD